MKTSFFLCFSLSLCISICAYADGVIDPKANVIVIMTDDQGYPELSFHGNPILKTLI